MGRILRVLLMVLVVLFSAGMNANAKEIKWEISENEDVSPLVSYSFESCIVYLNLDGGITAYATDFDWYGKVVTQTAIIKKTGDKSYFISRSHHVVQKNFTKGARFLFYRTKDINYDVFFVKCRDAAYSLPKEAQKAFLGHWNIPKRKN